MLLRQITKPQVEPITLADVESQCRIESLSDESAAVERFIRATRQKAESITRRALCTQTFELCLDAFPLNRAAIVLPCPPLQTVELIEYDVYDSTAGAVVVQTLSPSLYRVISDASPACPPGKIVPAFGQVWPTALDDSGAVRVRFVAGYGPTELDESLNVPEAITQWMLLNVATLYENRESITAAPGRLTEVDFSTFCDSLLDDYRVRVF